MTNSAPHHQPDAPRGKPRRGRPRRTDPAGPGLPEIIEAVVRLAGSGDCREINMRDVAEALNVSPKLLYRHVSGKAEMLDLAASSVLAQWPFPPSDMPWAERLTIVLRDAHVMLRRYPALSEPALLRALSAENSPQAAKATSAITDCLEDAGLSPAEARHIYTLYAVMALGEVTLDKAIRGGTLPSQKTPSADMIIAGLESSLHLLIAGIRARRDTPQAS